VSLPWSNFFKKISSPLIPTTYPGKGTGQLQATSPITTGIAPPESPVTKSPEYQQVTLELFFAG